ncbi:hypothetical protein AHF37_11872 [Paragonimus kellicotti]|nr:hypothetical protein AHF37_11872 [Paragonimus kellicotti]
MYRRFTIASDVWSFGVVGWEIFTHGERPYWDWTNQAVISMLERGYRLPRPEHCPPEVFGLISECWLSEADKRPEFAKITVRLQAILKEVSSTMKNYRTQNVEVIRRPEVADPTELKPTEWNAMESSRLERKEVVEQRIRKLYSLKCPMSGKLHNQMDTSSFSKCQQNGYTMSAETPLFVDLSPSGTNLTSTALYFNINPTSITFKERYSSLPRGPGKKATSRELLQMLSDICEGMKYISGLGYVHRDLAARNILINQMGTCKISDFGLARKIGEKFVEDAYTLSVSHSGITTVSTQLHIFSELG